jgi:hypothetical protein
MNRILPKISFRSCPSCGAALNNGAITCRSCGGLVVVESIFGQLKAEINYQVGRINKHLRDRTVLLWCLALCPIVILPPVLAIFLSFRGRNAAEDKATRNPPAPDVLILIVALCNIILSIMFWHWIGDTIISMGLSVGIFLKSFGVNRPGGMRSI